MSELSERWRSICDQVASLTRQCGRQPDEVTIVGVTKYVGLEQTIELYEAGCRHLGESRPQALWEKSQAMASSDVQWHLIGHLQRNKARRTIAHQVIIHSVDSWRLAEQLDSDAAALGKSLAVFLEVNVTEDRSKTGMLPEEALPSASRLAEFRHLRWMGLMGMAGLENPEPRRDFSAIRQLRDQLQQELGTAVRLDHLSMGMSDDFSDAIREGATFIRLGSILFSREHA